MGGTSYSTVNRSLRATSLNYATAPIIKTFSQQKERKAHNKMTSRGITLREARDSKIHPNSIPIILGLDVTGSMHHIPHHLIKEGLPKIMGGIIQSGVPDPALLFLAYGDHECDKEPLQVGQFESGDAELDMWLTQTYLEGGGGGNFGEASGLVHYFAAHHCQTDHWDKRKKKGIIITIGDEPSLKLYPNPAMASVMSNGDISEFTDVSILAEAQEKWEVFHIYPTIGRGVRSDTDNYWGQLLNDKYFKADTYEEIIDIVKKIVIEYSGVTIGGEATIEEAPQIPDLGEGPVIL